MALSGLGVGKETKIPLLTCANSNSPWLPLRNGVGWLDTRSKKRREVCKFTKNGI